MARLMSANVVYEAATLEQALDDFDKDLDLKIGIIFDMNAALAVGWMKGNAPWTDDTGAARSGLTAVASDGEGKFAHEMLLSYSVSYGIWLEVANSGRFQILGPAQRIFADKIMKDMNLILEGRPPSTSPPSESIPPVARKLKPVTNKSGNRSSRRKYGQRQQP